MSCFTSRIEPSDFQTQIYWEAKSYSSHSLREGRWRLDVMDTAVEAVQATAVTVDSQRGSTLYQDRQS
jgi:hypothetical protein